MIILHQQGMREFYHFKDQDDDEAEYSFQLTDEEARQIGAIMLGVDYQPVADDRMELFLRNVRMGSGRKAPANINTEDFADPDHRFSESVSISA